MATLEINIPIEVVEAAIKNNYGLDYGVDVLDMFLDEPSCDLVIVVYVDDEEFSDISMFDKVNEKSFSDTWTVTNTTDFVEGIL